MATVTSLSDAAVLGDMPLLAPGAAKQAGPSRTVPCASLESAEKVEVCEPYSVALADETIQKSEGPACCAGIIRRRSKRNLPFLYCTWMPLGLGEEV